MFKQILIATAAVAVFSATPAEAQRKTKMTPMEVQALQSKEFEQSKGDVFASVMTVLQDLGYQIGSADMATGFITAESANTNKTSFLDALGGQRSSGNTRVTAFIEQMPSGMARVRLNFMNTRSTSGGWGRNEKSDKAVLDAATYTAAWEKIDEALFVRTAIVEKAPSPRAIAPSATNATAELKLEAATPSDD